jgi:hypothetical protein
MSWQKAFIVQKPTQYEVVDLGGPDGIRVHTPQCFHCGKDGWVAMTYDQFLFAKDAFAKGALVQDAFPFLSPDEREMLISGTHPECWTAMFGDEDDDN